MKFDYRNLRRRHNLQGFQRLKEISMAEEVAGSVLDGASKLAVGATTLGTGLAAMSPVLMFAGQLKSMGLSQPVEDTLALACLPASMIAGTAGVVGAVAAIERVPDIAASAGKLITNSVFAGQDLLYGREAMEAHRAKTKKAKAFKPT